MPIDKTQLALCLIRIWKLSVLFIEWKLKISIREAMIITELSVGNGMTNANFHNLKYSYKTNLYIISTNKHKGKTP